MPEGHDLNFKVGISAKQRGQGTHLGLVGAYGTYPASRLLRLAEVGAVETVNKERMLTLEKEDVIAGAKRFEGPVWIVAAQAGDELVEDQNVGYVEEEVEEEDE